MGNEYFEKQAYQYFDRVIEQSDLLFQKTPIVSKNWMGLDKASVESKIEVDKLSNFFSSKKSTSKTSITKKKKIQRPKHIGFCIRTGTPIPFNLERPLSKEAYQEWNKFKNDEYEENYCHYSGKESHGKTSLSKPVIWENWEFALKASK